MFEVTVRAERPAEGELIRALNDLTFGGPVEGQIVDDMRGTDRWIEGGSLVAQARDGSIVGHLLLSEGELIARDGTLIRRIWMVGPVAVLPERQRRGVGGQLMRAAIELAVERHQPVLCLLGHATYYPRFGFQPARGVGIDAPHPWRDPNWMALRLPPGLPICAAPPTSRRHSPTTDDPGHPAR